MDGCLWLMMVEPIGITKKKMSEKNIYFCKKQKNKNTTEALSVTWNVTERDTNDARNKEGFTDRLDRKGRSEIGKIDRYREDESSIIIHRRRMRSALTRLTHRKQEGGSKKTLSRRRRAWRKMDSTKTPPKRKKKRREL